MEGGRRFSRVLLWLAVVSAAVALPGAGYLLGSQRSTANQVPFSNQGTDLGSRDVQGAIAELATRVQAVESKQKAAQTTVTSHQADLASLQTSSVDQAMRLAGQEERVSTLESKVAEAAPLRRRIDYAEESDSDSIAPNYVRLRDLGAFSKQHATTAVLLIWNTHVEAHGEPGTFCDFQLRIDGKPDTDWEGGAGRAVIYIPSGSATSSAVAVYALFPRVGVGSHTVGIWVRGSARTCRENPGNFPRSVMIEEGPRG
jgi:hypothetical protein